MTPSNPRMRIGIDVGGSKITAILLDDAGIVVRRIRVPAPKHSYQETLSLLTGLVEKLDAECSEPATVGVGIPGSLSPQTGLVRNANSTWLNGERLDQDLSLRLNKPVRIANDADCFAVSESTDGAGTGCTSVWGVILGTGCGSGLVINGKLITGPMGISGEWGHNPLPSPDISERNPPLCWCGRHGCLESWVSGPAIENDHTHSTGQTLTAAGIAAEAKSGSATAQATLDRHISRLARGMAQVINVIDPHIIVIGGGLSKMGHLYEALPEAIAPYVFSDHVRVDIRPPRWGDDSGVRGAAWLWHADREG